MRNINKADRPDGWYRGKMTQRHVPHSSRAPTAQVDLYPGSHAYADIGTAPIPDREGNKHYMLVKDVCSQYKVVYRFRTKDGVVAAWQDYIRDNRWPKRKGIIYCHTVRLTTDDDVLFVKGKIRELNRDKLIGNWVIAPYLHHSNPIEGGMRHTHNGATMLLYHSGLPPCEYLNALEAFVAGENYVWTATYYREQDKNKSPYVRRFERKPHINDIAIIVCNKDSL